MNQTVIDSSHAALSPLWRRVLPAVAVSSSILAWILVSVFVHPLPHEVSDRASAPVLPGADVPPSVAGVLAKACVNCHSEKTQWPWYSRVAPVSWLVENDVKHAREHLNLSRWDGLQEVDQRMLLTAIATVIENHEMPPHKYVVLHPEAKLSADDSVRVIEWTRAERRRLRATAAQVSAK
jgi:Haem-binding domain